jgi:hypothetical protein
MTYEQFIASTHHAQPPEEQHPALKAMWYDIQGEWECAHDIAQDIHSAEGSWIHAYLHRKEGDLPNARYWYRQAGKNEFHGSLQEEQEYIVRVLLQQKY